MRRIPIIRQAATALAGIAVVTIASAQVRTTAHPSARITAKVDSAVTVRIPGTHPASVDHATFLGRLPGSTAMAQMHLVLNASDDQMVALHSLEDQQQDKSSPNFHKWLTPEAFGQSFGAAPSDIAQITSWLQDQGLTVTSVAKSNRIITFSGDAAHVEAAFHTQMSKVQVNGVAHVANTTDITLPAAFAGVVRGVARLDDLFPTSPSAAKNVTTLKTLLPAGNYVAQDSHPLYGGATGTHFVSPLDVATIYNTTPLTSAGVDGTGQTISIIAQSNIALSDVQTFRSIFGLPKNDPTITIVGQDPGPNQDDGEAYLDAEWGGAMATGASVRFLVSAPSLEGGGVNAAALYAVENNIGDIISMSYGGCETNNGAAGTAFWNNLWEQAAAQGQTAFISTGDSSAAGCDASNVTYAKAGYGVNALGSSAYNVAVGGSQFVDFSPSTYWGATGGTNVPFNNALSYIPETPWNQGRLAPNELNSASTAYTSGSGIAGTGGGISIYTARPSWQTGYGIAAADPTPATGTGIAAGSPISGPHRLVPDLVNISSSAHVPALYCADEICSVNSSGQLVNAGLVGGTSVATPVQASMQALINQKNGGRQGNANYYYYKLAAQQYTASTTACQSVLGTAANPNVTLPAATCNFQDIVTGSNIVPTASSGTAGIGFSAGVGFDEASGLGSMNVANVANNWASVSFASTTTTLAITPSITTHGTTQNISVTVAPTTGTGVPTGDFSIIAETATASGPYQYTLTNGAFNGTIAQGGVLNTTQSTAALPAGSYKIHVHYAGDGTFGGSNSASIPVVISSESSSVSLASYNITIAGAVNSATSFAYGADVYVDTYVIPGSGNGIATGNVTYSLTRNGAALPSLTTTLDPIGNTYFMAGVAFPNFYLKPNYVALAPGTYVLTATYAGDNSFKTSTASTTFTINQLTPTATFTAPTAVQSGAGATFGYVIANPSTAANPNTTVVATGTVTFTDTTTSQVLGTTTLTNSATSFTTSSLTTNGANTITAAYSGDGNYAALTSTATVTVGSLAAPTVTVSTTSTTLQVGATITLKATLNPTSATGKVTFLDGTTVVGTASITTTGTTIGTASLGYAGYTAGTHNITASYGGSASYSSGIGTYNLVVQTNTPSLTINAPTVSTYGQPVAIEAELGRSPTTTGQPLVQPTGLINFYDGSTLIGSATPVFGPGGYSLYGTSLNITTLAGGTHSITATYVGDSNYASATSTTTLTVAINPLTPAITVSSPATVYAKGTAVTITAIIPASSVLATPTGTLTFLDNGNSIGTGTLAYSAGSGGFVASLTSSTLTGGTNSITAQLAPDGNYSGVTSTPFLITLPTNNIWVANANGTVSALSPTGDKEVSGAVGGGTAIAIDNVGDVWTINQAQNNVSEFNSGGTMIGTYQAGAINTPTALAIDGSGYVWITNGNNTLSVLSPSGSAVSTTAYKSLLSTPTSINVDGSGNLWITNSGDNSISEVIGAATPVTDAHDHRG